MSLAIIIFSCIVLSFFFSGMETGVLLLNRSRVRYLKERGSIGARILLDFLHYPGRLSSTVLVGNTIVNGVGVVLVAEWFLKTDGPVHAVGAVFLFAFIVWFFGELIPKALFRRFPNRLTTLLAPLLLLSFLILWPIIQIFALLSQLVVRFMGGKISSRQMFVTRDELKLMAHEGKETLMTGEQRNLVASILDSQTATAKDIMKPKDQVVTVKSFLSEKERLELSIAKNFSRLPVESEKTLRWESLWVAYDTLFSANRPERIPPIISIHTNLEEILSTLRKSKSPFAIVKDKEGHDLGIVTVEDVIRRYFGKIDL